MQPSASNLVLRPTPIHSDVHPELEHARHRVRRVKLAVGWSITAKCGSLLVTLISVPLAVSTLGAERFGIWITITTFFSIFSFVDGGIGNAVINMVADQHVNKDNNRLRQVISSAYLLLSAIGTLGVLLTTAFTFAIDWRWLISLPADISQAEIAVAALVVGMLYFTNIPLGLAAKILRGLQESHYISIFAIVSHAIIVIGTTIAWYFQASLTWFLLAFAIGPVVANGASTLLLRFRNQGALAPRLNHASLSLLCETFRSGSLFLGLQACAALAYQTDALIVSHLLGLEAAAELGMVNRMFLMATALTSLIVAPLWPAFRDAATRGELNWVRTAFRRSLAYSMGISLAVTLPLLLAHQPLIAAWSVREVAPSFDLILAAFIWTNMLVIGSLSTSLLNGLNQIRFQLIVGTLMVITNLPLSIILTQSIGTAGVIAGSIISYGICVLVPFYFVINNLLNPLHHTLQPPS